MRILALVTDAFGGYGGIARYNCDVLSALAGMSEEIEITILPRLGPSDEIQVLHNMKQHRPFLSRVLFAIHAALTAFRLKPDVIFCCHIYHGPLALALARLFGARLVSQLHGTEVWQPLGWFHLQPLLHSDLVLCVSRHTKACYERQAGSADNSFVLANMVGPSFTPGDRSRARERFDVTGCRVLLTVARLDTRDGYKGQDRVIEALPGLKTPGGEPLIYLIAGLGDDRIRLERIAKQHGVTDLVRFLGKVPESDLPDLYRAADLFVLPSTGEGFGIVYLEAMACGTPAAGLAVGGVPDPLGDGELGTLLPSSADFATALQDLILKPRPDEAELSRAVQQRFGLDAFCKRVRQVFGQLNRNGSQHARNAIATDSARSLGGTVEHCQHGAGR